MIFLGAQNTWSIHTLTGKSYKVSYKSKKTKKNPEEKQYFFPNTHEPLMDEETFELAQKRIATKHRPTKCEEIDWFSGFLFCGDCGGKDQPSDSGSASHSNTGTSQNASTPDTTKDTKTEHHYKKDPDLPGLINVNLSTAEYCADAPFTLVKRNGTL